MQILTELWCAFFGVVVVGEGAQTQNWYNALGRPDG